MTEINEGAKVASDEAVLESAARAAQRWADTLDILSRGPEGEDE